MSDTLNSPHLLTSKRHFHVRRYKWWEHRLDLLVGHALGLGVLFLLALLTSATQTQHKVESRLFLDVVVRKGAAVLQLLAGEDQTLLVRGNAFLVLDLGLDVLDGVRGLHIEGDGLTREGLDKNLHD